MELQVGVKIILKSKEDKYLVVLRLAEKYPEVGAKWEIAGGRIDPGHRLMENLKREVMEETGLGIVGEPVLIAAQDIIRPQKHIVRLTYLGYTDGDVVLSDEHTEYKWISLQELKEIEPVDTVLKEVVEIL